MWVFGGEFSSPNNSQFYHYKDLWVLHLKTHTWEHIKAPGGPSPRSGHRMIIYKKNLFVFGGFHESHSNFIYFNDCYMFSLQDYKWTKLNVTGSGPTPRSACQLSISPAGILLVGGYSKTRVKKDIEKGTAHTDMYSLTEESGKWKWTKLKDSGNKPWPRSNFAVAQMNPTRLVLFGGVTDEDEEESIESIFFNSMFCLDLSSHRWFPMELRKPKAANEEEGGDGDKAVFVLPCPRMNAYCAVKKNSLFLYGGVFEDDDEKEITLNDLWSIDLKKMDGWNQLHESDDTGADWKDEESDNEDEDDEDEDGQDGDEKMTAECSSNQSGEMEWTDDIDNANHPALSTGDSLASYWFRTREHWLETVCDGDVEEDERADELNEKAQKLARAWFERQQQKEE